MLNCLYSVANQEGIWVFWKSCVQFSLLYISTQYVSIQIDIGGIEVVIFFVHTSCDGNVRLSLVNQFINFNSTLPWMIVGEFNTVTDQNEKIGSILFLLMMLVT